MIEPCEQLTLREGEALMHFLATTHGAFDAHCWEMGVNADKIAGKITAWHAASVKWHAAQGAGAKENL